MACASSFSPGNQAPARISPHLSLSVLSRRLPAPAKMAAPDRRSYLPPPPKKKKNARLRKKRAEETRGARRASAPEPRASPGTKSERWRWPVTWRDGHDRRGVGRRGGSGGNFAL